MADHGLPATSGPILREEDEGLSLDFDNGTVQSRVVAADPARLVLEYTRLMMGFLLFQPAPARIAMIGLGGGSLARYCRRKLAPADFTAVEISPQVIALRDAFDVPPDGARFRVCCADGAAFVRDEGPPFDALLVDGFDRDGQPPQLCTPAFYDGCRARLAAGGVLVVNLHADDPVHDVCIDRIRAAFESRIVVVAAESSANSVVFAAADPPFPPPFGELVARLRALDAAHPVSLGTTLSRIVRSAERRPPRRRRSRA